ncbi:MAG TPA: hypothetical protein VE467_04625 [Chryseolinea sp.]|nr:hypothetical protein [Chryseolinea sp.]
MKFLKTISIFALAFLVLVSSSSFVVGIHWCRGEIFNLSVLSHAEGCGMEKNVPPCHKQMVASCCEDDTILHEGEGFKASLSDINISASPVLEIQLPAILVAEVIPLIPLLSPDYYNYDPPFRSHDLTVSYSVFLI